MQYRFTSYKDCPKTTCPYCGKTKHWVRYIDTENNLILDERWGKCDNAIKCKGHYSPYDHPPTEDDLTDVKVPPKESKDFYNVLPQNILSKSLKNKYCDNFSYWLIQKYGNKAKDYLDLYQIGCYKKNSTVFWQVDITGKIRSGKIIKYNEITGKRTNQITWAHSQLKIQDYQLQQCLFGEYLLKVFPNKKVCITEGEKTSVIASIQYPDYLFLSVGQLHGLSETKLKVLEGREVIFYPDKGAYQKWSDKLKKLNLNFNYKVSKFVEDEPNLIIGDDLADWILKNKK